MNVSFKNKNVLITGASRGLGKHLAQHFWKAGANLILVARSEEKLKQLRDELLSRKLSEQHITLFPTDLGDSSELNTLANKIIPENEIATPSKKHWARNDDNSRDDNTFFQIDILINNAAIQGPIGPLWENDWEAWQKTLQINLLSPIALCRAVIPYMIKNQYGKIINLSGGGATGSRAHFSAYAVSKSGLVRFSETLAEEVKHFPISVNCIAPGVMNTDMLKEIIQAGAEKVGEKEFQQASKNNEENTSIMERAAALCTYLASPESDGITGKLISAVWDPWKDLKKYSDDLKNSDIYTLRRIVPKDRGKAWGDVT